MTTSPSDVIPAATPATADLVCWLWAAFPPRNGHLHVPGIADVLGVSPTTLRRWIADATDRQFDPATQRYLIQRAILRGRGTYLWPPLDPATLTRSAGERENATHTTDSIARGIYPASWDTNGTLTEHIVLLIHHPRAHTHGVATVRTTKSRARIQRTGTILDQITLPHRYRALMVKHALLDSVADLRCIAPRTLVPTGRTDTWRARGYQPEPLNRLRPSTWRTAE